MITDFARKPTPLGVWDAACCNSSVIKRIQSICPLKRTQPWDTGGSFGAVRQNARVQGCSQESNGFSRVECQKIRRQKTSWCCSLRIWLGLTLRELSASPLNPKMSSLALLTDAPIPKSCAIHFSHSGLTLTPAAIRNGGFHHTPFSVPLAP